jgi:PilZ domain
LGFGRIASRRARGIHLVITERRGRRRFPLRLPLSVRPLGVSPADEVVAECKDVSSQGVYFFLQEPLNSGSLVEILLTLPSEITRGEPVRVRCEARVQRTENLEEGRVGIAAKIQRYRFLPGKRERRRAS